MLLGIQTLGIMFIAAMIYLTYLNYKKHNYGSKSFISWIMIWIIGGIAIIYPSMTYNAMSVLNIDRTQDFFYTSGFIVLFVAIFHMYITIKKTHAKVEKLVRVQAIKHPIKTNKKPKAKTKK